jgi:hypothetical protein
MAAWRGLKSGVFYRRLRAFAGNLARAKVPVGLPLPCKKRGVGRIFSC